MTSEDSLVHFFQLGKPIVSTSTLSEIKAERDAMKTSVEKATIAAMYANEAASVAIERRDALEKKLAETEQELAHLKKLFNRQISEIAVLRTFYARQDAASWRAVGAFDTKAWSS